MKLSVVDVFPPLTPGKRPLCEGTLSGYVIEQNAAWRLSNSPEYRKKRRARNKIPDDQCDNFARYKIQGKWYCRKHGACVALDLIAEKVS